MYEGRLTTNYLTGKLIESNLFIFFFYEIKTCFDMTWEIVFADLELENQKEK